MNATKFIWQSGKFVPWLNAKVHVLTHALHYGTGIFEGIRCYPTANGGAIFRLDDHVERFFHSASYLRMKIPFSKKSVSEAIIETVKKNKNFDTYIRPLAFYGYNKIGPNPANSPVELIIACIPLKEYLKNDYIKVKVSKIRRIPPYSAYHDSKITGMYFNSAIASLEAWVAGFDEAVVMDENGYIAEGSAENIFIIKGNKIITPPTDNILPGITRDTLLNIFKDLKVKFIERRISLKDLMNADEAFLTGTAVEIHSIGQVDAKLLPRKNTVTSKISDYYKTLVHGGIKKYSKWVKKINI